MGARFLDIRIQSKIQQIEALNNLATSCSSVISDMPRCSSGRGSKVENTVIKLVDLQAEINEDMNKLIELKKEIGTVIKSLKNAEYQTILEKRYLCGLSWERIAVDMNYSIQHIYRMHDWAIKEIKSILT